ncbi:MAG: hypothetical protein HYT79_01050 [Elusimicrobia bacterium]|nr:hypothetical protein [Elusimicrobiota bacterium]
MMISTDHESSLAFSWTKGSRRETLAEMVGEWKKSSQPLGFLKPPDADDIKTIKSELNKKRKLGFNNYCILGIGGSALPVKSLIHFFSGRAKRPEIWVLDTIDPATLTKHPALTERLDQTLFHIVSKSGSTLEVELLKQLTVKAVQGIDNKNWKERFLVTTTPGAGNPLERWAARNRISVLPLQEDIGGRFSSFSPVTYVAAGLMGLDLPSISRGAAAAIEHCDWALSYADLLGREVKAGKKILGFFFYDDRLQEFGELLLQLAAESLGKKGRGPAPLKFIGTRDQHSLLQLYLDGPKDKAATILSSDESVGQESPAAIDPDSLAAIERAFRASCEGTARSLAQRGIKVLRINIKRHDEAAYGELVQFFHLATVAMGRLFGINPFDQPMVELQKQYTRQLLQHH